MIKKASVLMLFLVASLTVLAQNGDAIIGKWLNAAGEDQIWIYKKGDKYFGKLGWIKVPDKNGKPKMDENNPDPKLRTRPDLNLELLQNFTFNGETWEDGTIYDPKSGKTYSCKMTLKDNNTLKIRGYIGISLLGRTEVLTRVK
ncbi:DUF2147 domain-containing protein [Mucilaginibacter rivuli]|uniref:DUF2147 domain-containing protein n=1 Tax=Mucilaginibacter rivuli TaxID=2857527 RepID=UPI0021050FB6|nr:DUF2147 domain-containing protein [Mucilaginibacter rivuli]